jgi:hypothetical protein
MCTRFSRVVQLLCLLKVLEASGSSLKAAVSDGIRLAALGTVGAAPTDSRPGYGHHPGNDAQRFPSVGR